MVFIQEMDFKMTSLKCRPWAKIAKRAIPNALLKDASLHYKWVCLSCSHSYMLSVNLSTRWAVDPYIILVPQAIYMTSNGLCILQQCFSRCSNTALVWRNYIYIFDVERVRMVEHLSHGKTTTHSSYIHAVNIMAVDGINLTTEGFRASAAKLLTDLILPELSILMTMRTVVNPNVTRTSIIV